MTPSNTEVFPSIETIFHSPKWTKLICSCRFFKIRHSTCMCQHREDDLLLILHVINFLCFASQWFHGARQEQVNNQGVEHDLQQTEQIDSRLFNNKDTQRVIQKTRKYMNEQELRKLCFFNWEALTKDVVVPLNSVNHRQHVLVLTDYHNEIFITLTGHMMTSLCYYALVQKTVYLLRFLVCFITATWFKVGLFVKRQVHQYNHTPHFSSRLKRIIEQKH